MPLARTVIVTVGVRTVGVRSGELVAGDGAADPANQGAGGPVIAPGDRASQQGSYARAPNRTHNACVAALLASLLGHAQGRDQRDRRDTGRQKMFTHGLESLEILMCVAMNPC